MRGVGVTELPVVLQALNGFLAALLYVLGAVAYLFDLKSDATILLLMCIAIQI